MKNLRLLSLFAFFITIVGCGDDDSNNQLCATCSDEVTEREICADTQSELDALTDAFLDTSEGSAGCVQFN